MGNPKGVKRDFEALEARRLKAAELLKKGWSQAEVAREVGVHRQSVSRWASALDAQGKKGLRATGGRGRRARLTTEDLAKIEAALERGPEALGYESGLWTLPRVADLIRQESGVVYHPGHVWKILRRLKWSVQRPVGQAVERNEEEIEHWKHVRWPRLKKTLPDGDRRSSSSTKAVSASAPTDAEPGRPEVALRSSNTTSTGRPSRRSRG
jgi:transposase